jgi:hypothetical protein
MSILVDSQLCRGTDNGCSNPMGFVFAALSKGRVPVIQRCVPRHAWPEELSLEPFERPRPTQVTCSAGIM